MGQDFYLAAPPNFVDKFQKFLWLAFCVSLPPMLHRVVRLNCSRKMISIKYIFFAAKHKIRNKLSTLLLREIANTSFYRTSIEFLFYRLSIRRFIQPTKIGGAVEESGWSSDMKIRAYFHSSVIFLVILFLCVLADL